MPKINVEMMMLIRLNCTPNRFITPNTKSQLSRMGAKPSRACLKLKWNDSSNTTKTKAMESHCSMSKSLLICISVSVV